MIEQATFDAIKQLSVDERMLLAEKIWNSIHSEQELLEVTKTQKAELDRRLDSFHASRDEGCSWDQVKRRIKTKK